MKESISKLRVEYSTTNLRETSLKSNPLDEFSLWLKEAVKSKCFEPNGMNLSTVSELGRPTSRVVLLKQLDQGFVFFTNYESRKSKQLKINPFASLTFWWKEIYRQVTVEGSVFKISRKESAAYFSTRPRGAQIAAIASSQSSPLTSREELEEIFLRIKKKYRGKKIPCPKNWGGFRLIPERMEFWQGHQNRLHDRFLYVKIDKEWFLSRLFP